jgi:anti-anti-sigma factor
MPKVNRLICLPKEEAEMSITSFLSSDDNSLTILIKGRFDFSSHQGFCESYEDKGDGINEYRLDMRDVTYLDSSALGMLLLLKDYSNDDVSIRIINCTDEVKKIFEIANFKKLFLID